MSATREARELVARILGGDQAAISLLLPIIEKQSACVASLLKHRFPLSKDDLRQDVYLALSQNEWHTLRIWRGDCSLEGWVRGVAISVHNQRSKKEGRIVYVEPEKLESHAAAILGDPDAPLRRRDLMRAIRTLKNPQMRYVIARNIIDDRPLAEIADELRITRNYADQLKKRAIDLIRKAFEEVSGRKMLSGSQHAGIEELALYVEGRFAPGEAERLEEHLDLCDECRVAVMVHREALDLEELGLTLAEEAAAAPPPQEQPGRTTGRFGEIFGGVVAGLGLTGTMTGMLHPTLASGDHVRNAAHPPSDVSEGGHHGGDHHDMQSGSGFGEATKHYGAPAGEHTSDYVHQSYPDTCAVQCQHLILNQFGVDVSEDQLMKEATADHIYAPGHGTQLEDVGKLLEAHGVSVHRDMNANVFNLATELAQGHKVIVGLDSGELWGQNSILQSIADRLGIGQADHAVIVSGLDTTDPHHPGVIVTDPGTGDVAKHYSLPEFLDAWKTSHFAMVATDEPTPKYIPEMVNFDYHTGHVAMVGGAPYEFAHELSSAAHHESDAGTLGKLESLFMNVVHGGTSVDHLSHALGHEVAGHGAMHDVVDNLMSFLHGSSPTGEILALFDTVFHDDMASQHGAFADHHTFDHHGTDLDHHSGDLDHHSTDDAGLSDPDHNHDS